jgi:hypothetical protein
VHAAVAIDALISYGSSLMEKRENKNVFTCFRELPFIDCTKLRVGKAVSARTRIFDRYNL